jgi:hypothetical protein
LEHLDLSNNSIKDLGDLPPILGCCSPSLKFLLLDNNNICAIPPELGLLSTLQAIDLRGNPQKGIRSAVLDGSCSSILNYLKSRLTDEDIQRFRHSPHSFQRAQAEMMHRSDLPCEVKLLDSGVTVAEQQGEFQEVITDATEQQRGSENETSLRKEIDAVTLELRNAYLTEAKKYALKKSLALKKAHLSRLERRLATQKLSIK